MIVTIKPILLAFSLFISLSISAQIVTPAKWDYKLSKQNAKQGDTIELVFKVKLDGTWHLYSNVQNYKWGPLPANFEFKPSDTYQLIEEIKPINSQKEYDDVFEVDVNYFEHTAEFRQKVRILKNNVIIKGNYEYQVCNEVNGMCILGEDEFEFNAKNGT